MEPELELTPGQARAVAGLRRRWPHAEIVVHARGWGLILEVRDAGPGGRPVTIAIARLGRDGSVAGDRAVPLAA